MRILVTLCAILLLLGAGGAWAWFHKAEQAEAIVLANLSHVQTELEERNQRLSIRYDSVSMQGFPLRPVVRLNRPCLDYSLMQVQRSLCADFVDIAVEDYGLTAFRVPLPHQVVAMQGKTSFKVQADAVPTLYFRLPAAELKKGKAPKAFSGLQKRTAGSALAKLPPELAHQYAFQLPKEVVLTVEEGEQSSQARFAFPLSSLKIWQPMRYDLARPYDLLFSLILEIHESGQK